MKAGKATIKKAANKQYFGQVIAANGNELIRTSETYHNAKDAETALKSAAVITIKNLF
jgi:uncharacterized protein YegP (UPF0339 family)